MGDKKKELELTAENTYFLANTMGIPINEAWEQYTSDKIKSEASFEEIMSIIRDKYGSGI